MSSVKYNHNLILILLAVLLVSCTDQRAVQIRYQAEKLLYEAERELRAGSVGPQVDLDDLVRRAARKYRLSMDYAMTMIDSVHPRQDPIEYRQMTYLAYQTSNRLSQLHFSARHFDTCVVLLSDLIQSVPLYGAHKMTSLLNLGRALQSAGEWDSAAIVYNTTLEQFSPPTDDSGQVVAQLLELPLHMYRVVLATGNPDKAMTQLTVAEKYYQNLAADQTGTEVGRSAKAILARLYTGTDRAELAVEELSTLLDPTDDSYLKLRTRIADIMATQIGDRDSAIAIYEDLTDHLSGADTVFHPILQFKIALARLEMKQFERARQILVNLKRNYQGFYASTPRAQQAMARTFEQQGKWTRAETEYKYLIESYRGSDEAMATFLYLADYYNELGRTDLANKWLHDAGQYYERLAVRGAGTVQEARALMFQADLAHRLDDWGLAASKLINLYEKFPDSKQGQQSLMRAAAIYRNRLDQPEKAAELIEMLRSALTRAEVWEN